MQSISYKNSEAHIIRNLYGKSVNHLFGYAVRNVVLQAMYRKVLEYQSI